MNRLQEKYNNEIVPAMIEKFGYKNIMQVPKLNKIVINMGVGEAKDNSKVLDSAVKDLEIIAGQKAVVTKITSIPLTLSTLSYSISGKISCSLIPRA